MSELAAKTLEDIRVLRTAYERLSAVRLAALHTGALDGDLKLDRGADNSQRGETVSSATHQLALHLYHLAEEWDTARINDAKLLSRQLSSQVGRMIVEAPDACQSGVLIEHHGQTASARARLLALSAMLDATAITSWIAWDCYGHGDGPSTEGNRVQLVHSVLQMRAILLEMKLVSDAASDVAGPIWEQRIVPMINTLDRVAGSWMTMLEQVLSPDRDPLGSSDAVDSVAIQLAVESLRVALIVIPTD